MTSTPPASLSDLAKRLKEAFELIRMHQELQQEDSEALNHAESNITEVRLILESQRDTREKVSAARDEMLANVYYTGDERALIVSCFWKVLKILDSHPDSTTGAEGS